MSQTKTRIENKNTSWDARLRFRVGATCEHNNISWINVTGGNSEPGVGNDWLKKNSIVEVLDVLTSNDTGKALSANQGLILKQLIDAIIIPEIIDNLTSTDPAKTLSANQGRILKETQDAFAALLASDDVTLDQLQEVVNYIKANREDLANLSIPNIAGLIDALGAKADDLAVIKGILNPDGTERPKDANGKVTLPEVMAKLENITSLYEGKEGETIQTLGYFENGDGGGGIFYWNSTSTEIADGGIILQVDGVPTGRWKRVHEPGEINAEWFGAIPGKPDVAPNIQKAIDYLVTSSQSISGGIINLPRGVLNINSPLRLYSTQSEKLVSITLQGKGMQNTQLNATGGLNVEQSLLNIESGNFVRLYDFLLNGNNEVKNIVHFKGPLSGETTYYNATIKNIRVENAIDNGFLFERGFLINAEGCISKGNQTGFNFSGFHTSTSVKQCYAIDNLAAGFRVAGIVYSSFINCASDGNREGYLIKRSNSFTLINCGAEGSKRSAFHFEASQAEDDTPFGVVQGIDCKLIDCFSFNNDVAAEGYGSSIRTSQVDTSKIKVLIDGFSEHNSPNNLSITSGGVALNHEIKILGGCSFKGIIASYYAAIENLKTKIIRGVPITTANTPIFSIENELGHLGHYSGLILINVGGDYGNSSSVNMATYLLLIVKAAANSGVVEIASKGLTAGSSILWPSFDFSLNTTTNQIEATPRGSTSGTFTFYIKEMGGTNLLNL